MATGRDEFDSKIDRILDQYTRHRREVLAPTCPSAEELLDYIDGRLDEERAPRVLEHLPFCDGCHDTVLSFKLPLEEASFTVADGVAGPLSWERAAGRLLEGIGPSRHATDARPSWWEKWASWFLRPTRHEKRFWLPAAAMSVVVLLSLVVWWRGRPSELSQLAYIKPPFEATELRSSENVADDPFSLYYQQGLNALLKSQGGLFKRVDQAKVDEAIQALEKAEKLAQAQENQTRLAECYFHLGKAYLKKNNLAQARKQFAELIKLEGSSNLVLKRQHEAKEILNAIGKLENPQR